MKASNTKTAEETVTRLMRKVDAATGWLAKMPFQLATKSKSNPWPVLPGAYKVGEHFAPVAVCTLTSNELFAPLSNVPGVAIAGRVYSANLGLEKLIMNVTANPAIRFLLVCGKSRPISRLARPWAHYFRTE